MFIKKKKKLALPVISAIIEREHNGQTEILVQTRWKPKYDPKYSGTLEIPAGKIEEFENVYDALKREVKEESGLTIVEIRPDHRTKKYSPSDDESFAFKPFCCQQQLKGGEPWIGFVFLCRVKDEEPVSRVGETKNVQWMQKDELHRIFKETPEKVFTLQLGVLEYYFSQ